MWITKKSKNDIRFLRQMIHDLTRVIRLPESKPDIGSWGEDFYYLTWIGHSTVLIKAYGIWILTDPVFMDWIGMSFGKITFGIKRYVKPSLRINELPKIDLVLISHSHMDHLDYKSLGNLKADHVVTACQTKDLFEKYSHFNVFELDHDDSLTLKIRDTVISITAFEVNHNGARYRKDTFRKSNGYSIKVKDKNFLFAGDTAFTNDFQKLSSPENEVIFIPIGAYDPWIHNHCNPEEAILMGQMTNSKFVLPIHHQTFKLSNEPLDEPIERFIKASQDNEVNGISWRIGDTFKQITE